MNEKDGLINEEMIVRRYDFGNSLFKDNTAGEDSLTIASDRIIRSVRSKNQLYRKEVFIKDVGQVECRVADVSYKEVSLKQTLFPKKLLIPVIILSILLVLALVPMYCFLSVDYEALEVVSNTVSGLILCAMIGLGIVLKVKGKRGTISPEETIRPSRYVLLLSLPFIYLLGAIGLLIFAGNKWDFYFDGPLLGYVGLIVLALADIIIFIWCLFGIRYEARGKTVSEIAILARGRNERLIVVESDSISFNDAEAIAEELGEIIFRLRIEGGAPSEKIE